MDRQDRHRAAPGGARGVGCVLHPDGGQARYGKGRHGVPELSCDGAGGGGVKENGNSLSQGTSMTTRDDTTVDLDNLTPTQKQVANEFLDDLLSGKTVSFQDYPMVSEQEFTRIADAIVEQVNRRH